MVKDRRRFTLEDKWIIGGDGTWKDLLVVSPYTKLTLDIIGALLHPRKYYTFKKILISTLVALYVFTTNPFTPDRRIDLVIGFLISFSILYGWTKVYRYLQIRWRDFFFTHRKSPNEPFVPLDKSGDPRSAILLKRHVLIGGDSGTGKSNAVWEIIEALLKYRIPFRATILDPAGGVELADLQDAPFTSKYVDRPTDADGAIIDFRDRMNERLQKMKQHGLREFDPTHESMKGEHWHYMLIDELLLCAAQIKQGVLSPLGEILAVGRKAGFLVIACTQLGQKTTLGDFRDLFPQRVCFGTKTSDMTDAVLGTGATLAGAKCHTIEKVGTGYLWTIKARGYIKFHTRHIKSTQKVLAHTPEYMPPQTPRPTTSANPAAGNFRPHRDSGTVLSATASTTTVAEPKVIPRKKQQSGEVVLYRLFSKEGSLVYVDIAQSLDQAFRYHEANDNWFKEIDRSKTLTTIYRNHDNAVERKAQLIESERPLWNLVR